MLLRKNNIPTIFFLQSEILAFEKNRVRKLVTVSLIHYTRDKACLSKFTQHYCNICFNFE